MKKIKTSRIEQLLQKIYSGNFDSNDIGMFFIWLRPTFINNVSLLDLANFVAHNDERDRGISFEHIHKFVKNFIEVSEKGGTIFGLPAVFNREQVINNLIEVLNKLNLRINKDKIIKQKDKIINCLLDLMEETEFHFKDPRVVRCFLQRENQKIFFCLNLNLKGPKIITSPNAVIRSNFFD